MNVAALDAQDSRVIRAKVAGTAALLVAKLHKIAERVEEPRRLVDKDAHDVYRIFRAIATAELAQHVEVLLHNDLSHDVTIQALGYLRALFAHGTAMGALMAGRAEEGVGDPAQVSAAVTFLAQDLLGAISGMD